MPAHGDDAACTGAGVRKPSMKETAMGSRLTVQFALWGLYEAGTVKPDFLALFSFIHSFV